MIRECEKRVVLLGLLGSGKTTLFNKLTGSNQKVSASLKSVTQQIVQGESYLGSMKFEIVDTPGFGAETNKIQHVAGILAGLSYGDIHQIIIIAKYERKDLLKKNLKILLDPLKTTLKHITIYISHFDVYQNELNNSDEQELKKEITTHFHVKELIVYKKGDKYYLQN